MPTTPVLDDFNRADEDPAAGWTAWDGLTAFGLKVASNKLRATPANPTYGGGYLPTVFSGGNVEHYFQIGSAPVAGYTEEWYYLLSDSGAQSPIRAGNRNCYRLLGAFPAANQMQVQRLDNGAGTLLGSAVSWTYADGDWLWIEVVNGKHRVSAKTVAAPDYTLVSSFTDPTYTAGVFGYNSAAGGAGGTIDDLGGGIIHAPLSNIETANYPKPKLQTVAV